MAGHVDRFNLLIVLAHSFCGILLESDWPFSPSFSLCSASPSVWIIQRGRVSRLIDKQAGWAVYRKGVIRWRNPLASIPQVSTMKLDPS